MSARRTTYLGIYTTQTPRYVDRPASRLPGAALALAVAGVALLVVAPETFTWLTELVASVLARLG